MINLVTGASGFLGSYLARTLLANGEQVRALRRPGSDLRLLGDDVSRIEWVESDLLDPMGLEEAVKGISTVYHAAAVVSFRPKDRHAMRRVNAEGTATLVNACLDAGIGTLVHVSSVAAIGRKLDATLLDEDIPWELNKRSTEYALSKHLAEREAWRGWAEGLTLVVVNPGTILGAGFWNQGTARFFARADEGLRFYTRGGSGFVDVRDAASACLLAVRKSLCGERYILVGENASYRTLFGSICMALGKPVPSLEAGPLLLGALWRWEALKGALTDKAPDLTRENARLVGSFYRYDNQKFAQASGMNFRSMSTSIADTAAVYRQSRKEGLAFGLLEPDVLPPSSRPEP